MSITVKPKLTRTANSASIIKPKRTPVAALAGLNFDQKTVRRALNMSGTGGGNSGMKWTKDVAALLLCRMGGAISCSRKKPGTILCHLYNNGKCNAEKVKAAKKQLIQAAEEILKKGKSKDK